MYVKMYVCLIIKYKTFFYMLVFCRIFSKDESCNTLPHSLPLFSLVYQKIFVYPVSLNATYPITKTWYLTPCIN